MSHVAIVGAEFGVFKTVEAHFGLLVVDRVYKDEDNGDDDDHHRHKAGDEGKVVLCNTMKQETY